MRYVIKDLIGQLIDTLKADSSLAAFTIARHCGEVNALMFNNPAYWAGMVKKLPFILIKYQGRTGTMDDSVAQLWYHQLEFSAYVGTQSVALEGKTESTEAAEVALAKIFDLWHGKMFFSNQTTPLSVLSGTQITTTEFNQLTPIMESGGQDERLIFTLPEITLYETKYNVSLVA